MTISDYIISQGYDFQPTELNNRWQISRCNKTGKKLWYIGAEELGNIRFSFGECGDTQKKFSYTSGPLDSVKDQTDFVKYCKKIDLAKEKHQIELAKNLQSLWADWSANLVGTEYSEYLFKKGFGREVPRGTMCRNDGLVKNILCVPMYDEHGEMWSIQQLFGTKKTFWAGSKTKGTMFELGVFDDKAPTLVGEGFASCLAAHKSTGLFTVVAFNTGNMDFVVKHLMKKYGVDGAAIVLLCDHDGATRTKTGKNPGMLTAQRISAKYQTMVALPSGVDGLDLGVNFDFADAYALGPMEVKFENFTALQGLVFEETREKPKTTGDVAETSGPDAETIEETTIYTSNSDEISVPTEAPNPQTFARTRRLASGNFGSLSQDVLPDWDGGKKNPRPLGTMNNFEAILRHVGAVLRYNVIKKDEEWMIPGEETSVDNHKNAIYGRIVDLCARVQMPIGNVDRYLSTITDKNQFNPVQVWIESRPWDGVSRFKELCATVVSKNEPLKEMLIKKWMLSAVAAAVSTEGIMTPGILVFQGAQYVGKTRWFMRLVPRSLGLTAEGKTLNPNDKDSVQQAIRYWLVELGEIDATFKKSDLAALKSFITRTKDMFRPAYARRECEFPRRTVFFGSVNEKEFLADQTGNRRYWVIECDSINHEHEIDMQQVWAEVFEAYKKGEKWWLDGDEMTMLNESNEEYRVIDPVEEKLGVWNWAGDCDWFTATAIYQRAFGEKSPPKSELNRVSSVVRKLNGGKSRKANGVRQLWAPKVAGETVGSGSF